MTFITESNLSVFLEQQKLVVKVFQWPILMPVFRKQVSFFAFLHLRKHFNNKTLKNVDCLYFSSKCTHIYLLI